MADPLVDKVKTALNETRLLILGVQVLLGFQFQSAFQDRFDRLPMTSKWLSLGALALFFMAAVVLIAPTMQHRLVEQGHASGRLLRVATWSAMIALALLAPALGCAIAIVIALHFGSVAGAVAGLATAAMASALWFGFGAIMGFSMTDTRQPPSATPLAARIEQLLMEARIIIPGAQALLGFQLTVMLTDGFAELAMPGQLVHAAALGLVAVNICLLMTPAALHRLSFAGMDSARFLKIGSRLVIAAPLFLAAGLAADVYVVTLKIFARQPPAVAAGLAGFLIAAGLWYVLPLALRARLAGNRDPAA